MRISLRGKCIEYVFADPRTQRELFPRQQKYLQAYHQVQGALSASSLPGLVDFIRGRKHPLSGGKLGAVLAELAWDPSRLSSTFLADGTERMVAGQSVGWIESSPARLLPSWSTIDKWTLEPDGAICNPN